jgi:hypothetical protein
MARRVIAIFCTALVLGCPGPDDFGRGFKDTRPEYMRELVTQLRASGVEYREGEDGMLRYRNRDEEKVKSIRLAVDSALSSGDELKWESEEHRRYFVEILEASHKKYRVEEREDGVWIRWYPENPAEAKELPGRVLERVMANRKTESLPCKGDAKGPSNLSLNKDAAKSRSAC